MYRNVMRSKGYIWLHANDMADGVIEKGAVALH